MKIKGGIHEAGIWIPCQVKLSFIGRVCASVPADKDLIQTWLDSRKPSVMPAGAKNIQSTVEEVINRLPNMDEENAQIEQRSTLIFEQVGGHLCVRASSVRAHLKDCANQVFNQFIGRVQGQRNLTTIIKNGLYVKGDGRDDYGTEMVYFRKEGGELIKKEDGFQDRMVRAKTPRGEISALKRFAYILQPVLEFSVVLLGTSVKPDNLELMLKYGAVHGFGGERSMQEGQYTFEMEYDEATFTGMRRKPEATPYEAQKEESVTKINTKNTRVRKT